MKHITILIILFSMIGFSQNNGALPYYEIPDYPETYTAGSVAARLVDGLGFRYYWASEGLRPEDLVYKPNGDARSTEETINHILDLSYVIANATLKKQNAKIDSSQLDANEKRKQTLINLKTAADILRTSDDISQYKIMFGERNVPFWNNINGPIADAIWHCGQLASFRRSSGNPINPNINHFTGTVKKQ